MTGRAEETKSTKQEVRHKGLYALIYGLALTGYAVFTLLYVFVIPHGTVSLSDTAAGLVSKTETVGDTQNGKATDDSGESFGDNENDDDSKRLGADAGAADQDANYDQDLNTDQSSTADTEADHSDRNISLTTEYIYDTAIYIATVPASYSSVLTSGLADDAFGRNVTEKTSSIAERVGATIAINGDFYGFRDEGYVIRNGYLYRDEKSDDDAEDLVVYADGSMEIIREGDITAQELLDKGALQVYSFGPGLVENGEIIVSEDDEVSRAMGSNPRTAIGQTADGDYILVVSDGRTSESEGLSLSQLAEVMKSAGCVTAYNLDGGGSSAMYYNGEIVNNPTTNGNRIKERKVSDIVYFK